VRRASVETPKPPARRHRVLGLRVLAPLQVHGGAQPKDEDQEADDARQDGAADEVVGAVRESVPGKGPAGWGAPLCLRLLISLKSDGGEASPDRVLK
jgi:hypothetical protein